MVSLRTINSKIGLRFSRSVNLGPDAGVVGLKRTVFQARPVAAHVAIKLVRARRIDGVVDSVYILEIGSQDALATQVDSLMRSERARNGRRINQSLKGRFAGVAKINALAEVARRYLIARVTFHHRSDGLSL